MQNDHSDQDLSFQQAMARMKRPEPDAELDGLATEAVAAGAALPIVSDDPPYLLFPRAAALEEEAKYDPTHPDNQATGPKRRRGPSLSEDQQMQIAVWLASGMSYQDAAPAMIREWGFAVTKQTWHYYAQVRKDLTQKAALWIAEQFSRFGEFSPIVRYNKLVQHAARLQRYVEQRGLYEAEHMTFGEGKAKREVTKENFNKDLSVELRATWKQIDEIRTRLEEKLPGKGGGQVAVTLDAATTQRFLEAAHWQPQKKSIEAPSEEAEE